jgi:hypothetical protein
MPPATVALTVVPTIVTAVESAFPVLSVVAVNGVMLPSSTLKVTTTFGTPVPAALKTMASISSCCLNVELAVSRMLVGAVVEGLLGPAGNGGGWYASQAAMTNDKAPMQM